MSTHLPGFRSFLSFSASARLATSSIKVKKEYLFHEKIIRKILNGEITIAAQPETFPSF